jgi:aspartate aminotransferase
MIGISERAKNCHDSATLAITAKAKAMAAEGKDVISFGAGEPDFEPPELIQQKALEAIRKKGSAKYTPASGLPELKLAIVEKFKRDNGLVYQSKNISVNIGAKHTIYNIFQAILNPGDEVIIPKPYWVSYPEMVQLAGGVPVFVDTDKEFKLHASVVERNITKRTKAIVINSPSNPTGAVIDEAELRRIAEVAVKHQVYVISDEIYEKIIYDGKHVSIASFGEEIKRIAFTVNGMSKSHAIPGWRLGYVAGPDAEIKALNNIQSHSTSNPASIVQLAAVESLNNVDEFLKGAVAEFRRRRDYIVAELNKIPGMVCPNPGGAFYVFPKIPIDDDWEFTNLLLDQQYVAVVPGSEFGMPGHVRLSYATSMENIQKGVERIKLFCTKLRTSA